MPMSKDHKKEPFMDLLDRNWLILVNLCRFYSSGETFLFEEMMQEVQLRLWEVYSVTPEKYFRGESAEMTWVFSVTRNVALSRLKEHTKHQNRMIPISIDKHDTSDEDAASRMESVLVPETESTSIMYELISHLKEKEKALVLYVLRGMRYSEIAMKMGISETNVATRVMRIKQKLRQMYQKKYKKP